MTDPIISLLLSIALLAIFLTLSIGLHRLYVKNLKQATLTVSRIMKHDHSLINDDPYAIAKAISFSDANYLNGLYKEHPDAKHLADDEEFVTNLKHSRFSGRPPALNIIFMDYQAVGYLGVIAGIELALKTARESETMLDSALKEIESINRDSKANGESELTILPLKPSTLSTISPHTAVTLSTNGLVAITDNMLVSHALHTPSGNELYLDVSICDYCDMPGTRMHSMMLGSFVSCDSKECDEKHVQRINDGESNTA